MKNKIMAVMAVVMVMLVIGAAYVLVTGKTFAPQPASAAPVLYSENTVTAIYESANPAVVGITVTQQRAGTYGRFFREGQGSGFLIDNQGHILTNNHVIAGASDVQVILDDGKTVRATVTGADPVNDLAVISVDPAAVSGVTPLQLADSSLVKPGQMAIAMGSPYGLDDSITVGVISGLDRSLGRISGTRSMTGMLQTDAAINPGNSGGPLLNAQGQVIGINTAIEADASARGVGFAVPSNVAKRVLPDLLLGQEIKRPWLGISGTPLTAGKAQELGLAVDSGVYIVTVVPDSPASQAGLKGGGTTADGALAPGGDVITAVDGKPVATVEALSTYLNTKRVGETVELSVLRDGQSLTIQVTLGAWPDNLAAQIVPQPVPPQSIPWPWGGRLPYPFPSPED
ncbi:MAG: trypsin-like peptidase domain-containing protein [Chloroflexi bacterium]|nr:trypsin-like peptidase domain-containing protein [Chloroflexota bacterium]